MKFKTSQHIFSQIETLSYTTTQYPFAIKRGKGVYLYDFDQNRYTDYSLNNGSLILGHAHPKVTREIKNILSKGYIFHQPTPLILRLGKLIRECYPNIDIIRFIDSKRKILSNISQVI